MSKYQTKNFHCSTMHIYVMSIQIIFYGPNCKFARMTVQVFD